MLSISRGSRDRLEQSKACQIVFSCKTGDSPRVKKAAQHTRQHTRDVFSQSSERGAALFLGLSTCLFPFSVIFSTPYSIIAAFLVPH